MEKLTFDEALSFLEDRVLYCNSSLARASYIDSMANEALNGLNTKNHWTNKLYENRKNKEDSIELFVEFVDNFFYSYRSL